MQIFGVIFQWIYIIAQNFLFLYLFGKKILLLKCQYFIREEWKAKCKRAWHILHFFKNNQHVLVDHFAVNRSVVSMCSVSVYWRELACHWASVLCICVVWLQWWKKPVIHEDSSGSQICCTALGQWHYTTRWQEKLCAHERLWPWKLWMRPEKLSYSWL